jgi:Centromere DNA-binding protein complex CBF3 subunit, domain 2/Transcriptional activator of glycolytic enzymes
MLRSGLVRQSTTSDSAPAPVLDNNVELYRHGQEALEIALRHMNENTRKAYEPKQKEWVDFCIERRFEDGQLVTEDKLCMFLRTKVFNRTLRTSRFKKYRTDTEGKEIQQTLGMGMINEYCSAIILLWKLQSAKDLSRTPNPRGIKLKGLLKDRERNEFVRRRNEYRDRGAGTLQDGYNEVHMERIVRACWTCFQNRSNRVQTIPSYLRTAVDFLLSHAMLLRGETRRTAQLADLFTLTLENEGPTPCKALLLIIANGKTNQVGRIEYGTVVRHQNVLLCTISQLAFYLFYRWNIVREPVPSFQRRHDWYDIHLLLGAKREVPLSYAIQLEWINDVFRLADLAAFKKTHLGRSQGARYAELSGVSEGQIRRAGRWNNDALTNCYLTAIPRQFVRSMAGFPPEPQGNFYLPRAKILPPSSLLRTLWPWIDEWQHWFASNIAQSKEARTKDSPASYEYISPRSIPLETEDREDLAAQGFLRLLAELRTILLQDSVLLRREFPEHPIWQDPIFVRDDYRGFAEDVERSLLETDEPEAIRLRRIVPDLTTTITNSHRDLVRGLDLLDSRTTARLDTVIRRIEDMQNLRFAVQIQPLDQEQPYSRTPPTPEVNIQSISTTVDSTANPRQSTIDTIVRQPSPLPPSLDPTGPPPPYQMSRTIQSVHDLWREWTVGLGSGPAIQALEQTYGASWRPTQSERVFFGRRKLIIDEIQRRQRRTTDLQAAIDELELIRIRRRTTLHGLWKLLQQTQKEALL